MRCDSMKGLVKKSVRRNEMSTVKVDFSKEAGRMKPLHGVGGGPISGNFTYDTSEYFKAA